MTNSERMPLPSRLISAQAIQISAVVACIVAFGVFLFADLGSFPIVFWDESRLAVNSLEMSQRGLSLVTTYQFAPDLWNTKPPLLIWLQSISLNLFSSAEFAVRFPSGIAALATLICVGIFAYRLTRSLFAALIVCVLLAASRGFSGTHMARTGDYDALLTLFTTAYALLIFEALHSEKRGTIIWIAVGLTVAGAVLTKGVAGAIPGLGIALYLLASPRLHKSIVNPWVIVGAGISAAIIAMFFLLREAAAPGYLAAVWKNEFSRYNVPLDPNLDLNSRWSFLIAITRFYQFSLGPLTVIALLGVLFAEGRARSAILFTLVVAATFLCVISFSETRYFWYAAPVFPLLAIACGISIYEGLRRAAHRLRLPDWTTTLGVFIVVVGLALVAARAVKDRYSLLSWRESTESGYGELLPAIIERGNRDILVVDPGRGNGAGEDPSGHYNPTLHFYSLLFETRNGVEITNAYAVTDLPSAADNEKNLIVSCSPEVDLARLPDRKVERVEGCNISTKIN